MRTGVHGEHEIALRRPLEPGEALETWVEGHGGRVVGNNTLVTIRFETLDTAGNIVAEQWWTTVLVVLDAVHGCVVSRGTRQTASSTVTLASRGALSDPVQRAEIIALIGRGDAPVHG